MKIIGNTQVPTPLYPLKGLLGVYGGGLVGFFNRNSLDYGRRGVRCETGKNQWQAGGGPRVRARGDQASSLQQDIFGTIRRRQATAEGGACP
jgi:hypothetical protein